MSEGIFREAGRDEDGAIRSVLAEAFPDNPKARPEMTAWQYWDNPFGESRTWVYEDEGRVVAVYTGVPVPVLLGGRPGLAALGIDAAVAPSHQGRRLFSPLSRALYEDLGRHGMTYTLAYPSTASYKGITRAGWRELAQLRVNVLPLSAEWVADRFRLPRGAAQVGVAVAFRTPRGSLGQRCTGVPSEVDQLWELCASRNHESGVVRDGAWWRWRYGGNPDQPYHYYETRSGGSLTGAAVTRAVAAFGGRFAYVLELLAADQEAAGGLVGAIAAGEGTPGGGGTGAVGGADGVALVTLAGSAMDRFSRVAGFRRLPRRLEPHPQYFGAVPNTPDAPDPTVLTWSVAWGDLDHL
ncbi:MAG: GNAT family N-acetyltransferase [Acidimicrobiales bacterium]